MINETRTGPPRLLVIGSQKKQVLIFEVGLFTSCTMNWFEYGGLSHPSIKCLHWKVGNYLARSLLNSRVTFYNSQQASCK